MGRLAVVAQHKERCRVTPCKWSSNGKRCPAGKHCMYDHSAAPQIVERRRGRNRSIFDSASDSDSEDLVALFSSDWLFDSVSDDDSYVESDSEIEAALASLTTRLRQVERLTSTIRRSRLLRASPRRNPWR